ncbi:MAG: ABC transporter permease [Sphaerochaetaceae bacterium]|nr:ABC transporter permease [Sphaerochaetaceae bacterium]
MKNKINFKKITKSNESMLFTIFIIIFGLMSILSPGKFLSPYNLQSMAFQLPEFGLFALGMMLVITTGGIDLSLTYTATLGMVVGGLFMSLFNSLGANPYLVILGAVVIMICVSMLAGLFNGIVVSYFSVAPMIATLGTATLYEGISLNITKGGAISGFPIEFISIGNSSILGIPIPMIIFIIVAICLWYIVEKGKLGAEISMIGCSPKVCEYSGIKVKTVLLKTYLMTSFLVAIAGIIMASRYNSSKESYGSSYLLQAVSACVLGGTDIMGGQSSVTGTIIAVLIIQTISSGLNIFGLNRYLTTVFMGLILILVLVINYVMELKSKKIK